MDEEKRGDHNRPPTCYGSSTRGRSSSPYASSLNYAVTVPGSRRVPSRARARFALGVGDELAVDRI